MHATRPLLAWFREAHNRIRKRGSRHKARMVQTLAIFIIGVIVGGLGSMLGIGGGVLLIPLLTGIFGLDIKTAIGASIISVIATSSAAGAVYLERGLTHSRLAMVLEIATTAGALAGGITAVLISSRVLELLFGLVLVFTAYSMRGFRGQGSEFSTTGLLDTSYRDPLSGELVTYGVHKLPLGMGASFLAGNISGLLGIGGGVIKVPIMNLVMKIPMRASIATSNFMIGVTAAASATVYYQHGYVNPNIAIPTALGVLAGARFGTITGARVRSQRLKQIFQVLLVLFSAQMFVEAFRR
jgi:uncharacterized membrane protein YfcA